MNLQKIKANSFYTFRILKENTKKDQKKVLMKF